MNLVAKKTPAKEKVKKYKASANALIWFASHRILWLSRVKLATIFPELLPFLFSKSQVINLEPTNACNLNCIMCIRGNRPIGMMQLDLFRHLIDEAADMGGVSLYLHVGGESLLHPRFVEMLG